MSLKKLFNFDYFTQNIKKSKMSILLFLLVVPIFTSLVIITSSEYLLEDGFISLGGFNIFFMYITPFILSLSLFGYVYKKRSADFMCSMPISRKTVFSTNTIGGIVLIVLMQLLTLICTFLLFWATKGSTFPGLVLDIFIYQTIAYIFMFAVCNLAMSVSGNFVTQIVVILLILFVVPASVVYFHAYDLYGAKLVDGEYVYDNGISVHRIINFTAPSLIANGEYLFNSISLIKMIILSIIYTILGLFAFDKKKMEVAGESFENKNVHFIVKGLTLIPFAMVLTVVVEEGVWQAGLFLVAIVGVYYLVYDLLTNKKSKFLLNIGLMLVSLIVLFGFYKIIGEIGKNKDAKIDINDIKSYSVTSIGYTDFYVSDYKFTDVNLLKKIIAERKNNDWDSSHRINLDVRLKNGSKANITIYSVSKSNIEKLLLTAKNKKLPSNVIIKLNNVMLTKSQADSMIKELNNYIDKNGLTLFYEKVISSSNRYMTLYTFDNHEVISMGVPIDLTNEIFEKATQIINNRTYEIISRNPYRGYYLNIENTSIIKKYMDGKYYYGEAPDELIKLILDTGKTPCSLNEEYVAITLDGNTFYTNKVQEVASIIKDYGNSEDYKYFPEDESVSEYYPTQPAVIEEINDIIQDTEESDI